MTNKLKEKHYRFYADSDMMCSIGELVSNNYASRYTFEDSGLDNMGHRVGLYDIYIENVSKVPNEFLDYFKKYEIVEMTLEDYNNLINRDKNITYDELYSKYENIIKPKIDEIIADENAKVREELLSYDLNDLFKDEIEKEVFKRTNEKYLELLKDFETNHISYENLNFIYREKIDFTIKEEIIKFKEKFLNFLLKNVNDSDVRFIVKKYFKEEENRITIHYSSEKEIHDFKEKLVDRILTIINMRPGCREYYINLKRIGKVADLIEGEIWHFFLTLNNEEQHGA